MLIGTDLVEMNVIETGFGVGVDGSENGLRFGPQTIVSPTRFATRVLQLLQSASKWVRLARAARYSGTSIAGVPTAPETMAWQRREQDGHIFCLPGYRIDKHRIDGVPKSGNQF
jgi:hypothetical protein